MVTRYGALSDEELARREMGLQQRQKRLEDSQKQFEKERTSGVFTTAERMKYFGESQEEAARNPFTGELEIVEEKDILSRRPAKRVAEINVPGISATTPEGVAAEMAANRKRQEYMKGKNLVQGGESTQGATPDVSEEMVKTGQAANVAPVPGVSGAVTGQAVPDAEAVAPDTGIPGVSGVNVAEGGVPTQSNIMVEERDGPVSMSASEKMKALITQGKAPFQQTMPKFTGQVATPEGFESIELTPEQKSMSLGGGRADLRKNFRKEMGQISEGKFQEAARKDKRKQSRAIVDAFEKLYDASPEMKEIYPDVDFDEVSPAQVRHMMKGIDTLGKARSIQGSREGFDPKVATPEGIPEGYKLVQTSQGQYQVIKPSESEEDIVRWPYEGPTTEKDGRNYYWDNKSKGYRPVPAKSTGGSDIESLFGGGAEGEEGAETQGGDLNALQADLASDIQLLTKEDPDQYVGPLGLGGRRRERALKKYKQINKILQAQGKEPMPLPEALGGQAQATGAPSGEAAPEAVPAVGTVDNGFRFKGGDPNDPKSWEAI